MVREEIQYLYAGDVEMYGALNSPFPPPKPAFPSFYPLSPCSFIHPGKRPSTLLLGPSPLKHLCLLSPLHVPHLVLASLPLNYISDLTTFHHLQGYHSSLSH